MLGEKYTKVFVFQSFDMEKWSCLKSYKDFNLFNLKMLFSLVVVVVAFFICWIPFHSQRLMFVVVTLYGEWTVALQQAQHVLFMVSGNLGKN